MSSIKNIVGFVVVLAVLFFGYKYFFVKEAQPALTVQGNAPDGQTGKEFLVALINLQNINLDAASALLSDTSFSRLRDMSVSLPDEEAGRPNPFRPIGNDTPFPGGATTTGSR